MLIECASCGRRCRRVFYFSRLLFLTTTLSHLHSHASNSLEFFADSFFQLFFSPLSFLSPFFFGSWSLTRACGLLPCTLFSSPSSLNSTFFLGCYGTYSVDDFISQRCLLSSLSWHAHNLFSTLVACIFLTYSDSFNLQDCAIFFHHSSPIIFCVQSDSFNLENIQKYFSSQMSRFWSRFVACQGQYYALWFFVSRKFFKPEFALKNLISWFVKMLSNFSWQKYSHRHISSIFSI